MATMRPIDVFNSLTDKEKAQVRASLNIYPPPCVRVGHKYKYIGRCRKAWFMPLQDKLVCQLCGNVIFA
jgi:hypothetical protein